MKLLIRRGHLIDPASGVSGMMDLLLEDGRVAALGDTAGTADQIVEAEGLVVCPGLVDMHVHLRDPGFLHKETIPTGRAAAAAGGFTSVACMPNTKPVADSPAVLEYILDRAKATPGTRVLPIGALTAGELGETLTDAAALKKAGAVALSDDGMPVQDANVMRDGLQMASRHQLNVLSHCEDKNLVQNFAVNEGTVSRTLGIPGRPAIAEELMVCRDAMLAEETGGSVHICHVSTARSVSIIRRYKSRGVHITCETCPQYFTLTEGEVLRQGALARVNPPLRTRRDVEGIIAGLADGTIDAIATDHAPHATEEKALPLTQAPSGMAGLETALALALTQLYHTKKLSLSDVIEKMTINPANILHVPYGRLAVGSPADVTVFNPDEEWIVNPGSFRSLGHNTPFGGWKLKGKVKCTIVSGQVVYQG